MGEGGYAVWNSKHMGGFSFEFPEKIAKSSREIADLLTFLVVQCKSSTNRLKKWDKEINQAGVLKHSLDE